MMGLLELAVKNARLTIVTLLFFLMAGSLSYISIPKEAEPDVQFPVVYVGLSLQGVSPEDAERLLIRPLESELQNIKESIRSPPAPIRAAAMWWSSSTPAPI